MTKLVLLALLALFVAVIAGGYKSNDRNNGNGDNRAHAHENVYYGDAANERGETKYDKARDMETKFYQKVNAVPNKVQEVGGRAASDSYGESIEQQKYDQKDDKIQSYAGKYRKISDSVGSDYAYSGNQYDDDDYNPRVPPRTDEVEAFRDKYNNGYGETQLDQNYIDKTEGYAAQYDQSDNYAKYDQPRGHMAGRKVLIGKGYQNMDKTANDRGQDKLDEKEKKADQIAGKYHHGANSFVMSGYDGRVGTDKYRQKQNRAQNVAGKYHRGSDSLGIDVQGMESGSYSRYSDRENKVQNLEQKFEGLADQMKKKKQAQEKTRGYD